ncbi:MAG: cytochrome P450 [Dermatophilaceae bacterium]|nr:cytochrome P450 [Intrasporangiaceae bacterium]
MSGGGRTRQVVRWGLSHGIPGAVFRRSARRGDLHGRLVMTAMAGDPDEVWQIVEDLRDQGPLVRSGLAFVSVDHAVCREVLSSSDFRTGEPDLRTSMRRLSRWSASPWVNPLQPPSLLVTEPPDHTRYRRLVTKVFTHRAVLALRERTEKIAADLLDEVSARRSGPVDLVDAYCSRLPLTVICEILGVPDGDRDLVRRLGSTAAASLDLGMSWSRYRVVDGALRDFDRWLTGHLEHVRREPSDTLLSRLVRATDEGAVLTDLELRSTAGLVLVAGFETTVNLLGNAIVLLTENPDQLDRLRSAPEGEPGPWANAADEALRLDPPVLLTGRFAIRDTTVAGKRVPQGAPVLTVLAGANRDPAVFPEPGRFDVARPNARDHLAFSAGRHHCLGAQLARMEGDVGLRALFERHPDLRLLPGARRRPTRVLRGYAALPAHIAAPAAASG